MHPHVVADHYKSPDSIEFTVSENKLSLSGEGFTISDPDGNVIFRMDGHAFSVRDRCTLLDASGCPILNARKKLLSFHDRWEVAVGDDFDDDHIIFTVKKSSVLQFKTHLNVYLKGNDNDDEPDFEVKGNFFERHAEILYKDQLVAEIKRKYTVGNVLLDKHTFSVVVHSHVDQAFIATLVIILDLIQED